MSAFVKPGTDWEFVKENDEIQADVDNNPKDFNGRVYRNFRKPKVEAVLAVVQGALEARVAKLEAKVFGRPVTAAALDSVPVVNIDEEIDADSLPF